MPKLTRMLVLTALKTALSLPTSAQVTIFEPTTGTTLEWFGLGVAQSDSGDVALVGSFAENGRRGAAYFYRREGEAWVAPQKVMINGAESNERFGVFLTIAGNGERALITAWGPDGSGRVRVYRQIGGVWMHEATLVSPVPSNVTGFGYGLSLSDDGTLAFIGEPRLVGSGVPAGAVHVFRREGLTWRSGATLAGDASTPGFGHSVAATSDGSCVIVGASRVPDASGEPPSAGAAYIFCDEGGVWQREAQFVSAEPEADLGYSVAIAATGERAFAGAQYEDSPLGDLGSGAVHVYAPVGGVWAEEAILRPDSLPLGTYFGHAVSVSGDGRRALVGMPGSANQPDVAGSAILFDRGAEAWAQSQRLALPPPPERDGLGIDVALNSAGDQALVGGARFWQNSEPGAAYVFAPLSTQGEPAPASPTALMLTTPQPNPAHSSAALALEVGSTQNITLAAYDVLGRRVALLYDGLIATGGPHVFPLNVAAWAPGVYAVEARGEDGRTVQRLTVAR